MGSSLVLGCGLISFGPSVMLWFFVVSQRAPLIIIAIVSAFFWLVSILMASLLWTMFPKAKGNWLLMIIAGVSIQEFCRLALVRLYLRTESVIARVGSSARRGGGWATPPPWRGDHHLSSAAPAAAATPSGGGTAMLGGNDQHQSEASRSLVGGGVDGHCPTVLLPLNDLSSSIAGGVGWGGIHTALVLGTVLAENSGKGVSYTDHCPAVPVVLLTARAWTDQNG
ncbi:unnamed protein product [Discosporangium mesarthrocarpum]